MFASLVLIGSLIAGSAGATAPTELPSEKIIIRVCRLELTEAGTRARFRSHYVFSVATDDRGRVEQLDEQTQDHPPFVVEDSFESCIRSWQLAPERRYGVVLSIGTDSADNTLSVTESAGPFDLRLILPRN